MKLPENFSENILRYLNLDTLRNVMLVSGGIVLFIAGVVIYGVVLNAREKPLTELMSEKGIDSFDNPIIMIERKNFTLSLYEDSLHVKTYRASFGRNLGSEKSRANDNATPVGEYEICAIDSNHSYHKFFKINYPNLQDINEALRKRVITQIQYDKLRYELLYEGCPVNKTVLGYDVGIHGIGRLNAVLKNLPFVYNWTDGSIAISNESMDEIISVISKGTRVVIR